MPQSTNHLCGWLYYAPTHWLGKLEAYACRPSYDKIVRHTCALSFNRTHIPVHTPMYMSVCMYFHHHHKTPIKCVSEPLYELNAVGQSYENLTCAHIIYFVLFKHFNNTSRWWLCRRPLVVCVYKVEMGVCRVVYCIVLIANTWQGGSVNAQREL